MNKSSKIKNKRYLKPSGKGYPSQVSTTIFIAIIGALVGAAVTVLATWLIERYNNQSDQRILIKSLANELLDQAHAAFDSKLSRNDVSFAGANMVIKQHDLPPSIIWTSILTKGQINLLPADSRLLVKYAYDYLEKYSRLRANFIWKLDAVSGKMKQTVDDETKRDSDILQKESIARALWATVVLERHYSGVVPDSALQIEPVNSNSIHLNQFIVREGAIFDPKYEYKEWISMSIKHGSVTFKIVGFWPTQCDSSDVGLISTQNENHVICVCGGNLLRNKI